MKITLDIKPNTINTILGQAAKHNGVDKKDVTNNMFMDEFAHSQRWELFSKVSSEFEMARRKYVKAFEEEQLKALLDQATIQKDVKEGYLLQVEGNAQYVYRGNNGIRLRISYAIPAFDLLQHLGINSGTVWIVDSVDQGDGTRLIKLAFKTFN